MILPGWMLAAKGLPWKLIGAFGLVIALLVVIILWRAERADRVAAEGEVKTWKAAYATKKRELNAERAAGVRRVTDTRALGEMEKELSDAIDRASPGNARQSLNCLRLRRAGTPVDQLPAPCRLSGTR